MNWKQGDKIELVCKPYQPSEWLEVEGKVAPGGIGATKYQDAEFKIVEKGYLEVGTIKPAEGFIELFFYGEKNPSTMKGSRWILRKLKINDRWTWLMFRPKDQRPYIETHPKEKWPRVFPPKKIKIDQKEIKRDESINEEKLSFDFESLSMREEGLQVGLIALSEGVWNGLFWPREVILDSRSYRRLEGKPVCREHNLNQVVGKVTSVEPFDDSSIFAEALITDSDTIEEILSSKFESASVRVIRESDQIRKIVERIIDYKEISLVKHPACKVCKITYVNT
ncbi:MAG TPA: hypothetical protein EYP30_04485 [Archaeoglobaceae archaeon]|nr:hypothetical protein [Archaeoglobaceae archaeon]